MSIPNEISLMIRSKKLKFGLTLLITFLVLNWLISSLISGPDKSEGYWKSQESSELSLYLELRKFRNDLSNFDENYDEKLKKDEQDYLLPPNIIDFLPHITNDLETLRPSLKLSKENTNVSLIIGIPTVKRQKESYLSTTLGSIFENISNNKTVTRDILIVVMIAEYNDMEFINNTSQALQKDFGKYIDEGVLDIIAPSPRFYPNFSAIELNFGDGAEQVKWRSKQNLDYAYLMMYAKKRGSNYYIQLEDDILVAFKYFKYV